MTQGILDVGSDRLPEEAWVPGSQIVRGFVPQCLIDTCFLEFVKQRRKFSHMVRGSQLANQIGSPHQARIVLRALMITIMRYRKSGALNIGGNSFRIDNPMAAKAFTDKKLATV